jgi:hypothetical protein
MKKIASFVSISLAAVGLAAGCSVEVQEEGVDVGEAAVCNNVDGTNAMLASLASAIGNELGRWEMLKDFEIYRGYNNQEMIRVKSASRSKCLNNCRNIDYILQWQDSRNDQLFVFKGGQKLNSWTFASRLVNGYRAQQTCEARSATDTNTCKITEMVGTVRKDVHHFLEKTSAVHTTCDGVDQGLLLVDYKATRGKADGTHGELSPEALLPNANQLNRKLVWAYNGITTPNPPAHEQHLINPYLQFAAINNMTVQIDPGGDNGEEPPTPGGGCRDGCQVPGGGFDLSQPAPGQCCTCNSVAGFYRKYTGPRGNLVDTFKCTP